MCSCRMARTSITSYSRTAGAGAIGNVHLGIWCCTAGGEHAKSAKRLVGSTAETTRTGKREPRGSREEVGRRNESGICGIHEELNADSTWQESFTRSPVWTMKLEDRLIPASLWPLTRSRKLKQETTARQVHFDSGTYRNGAGPTHFHQFGILLFLRL